MLLPSTTVTFEEPAQNKEPVPAFFKLVAAISAHGWNMPDDDGGTYDDFVTGVRHIDEFRSAHPSRLRRFIQIRYVQKIVTIEGEKFRVEQFVARCVNDPAFFRAALRHPKYDRAFTAVCEKLPRLPRHLAPTEHFNHGRIFLVPIGGGDTELLTTMDRHFQSSWS